MANSHGLSSFFLILRNERTLIGTLNMEQQEYSRSIMGISLPGSLCSYLIPTRFLLKVSLSMRTSRNEVVFGPQIGRNPDFNAKVLRFRVYLLRLGQYLQSKCVSP